MDKKYKKEQFKTPGGYFEDFNARLKERMAREEGKLPAKEGFTVPEGYFEGLNQKISEKIEAEEGPKVIRLRPYKKYYLAAASIAAAVMVLLVLRWNSKESLTFEDLAQTEIQAYLESTDLELNSYELAELVTIEELEADDFLENTLEEENIIEYLDENLEDFEDLNGDFGELNLESNE